MLFPDKGYGASQTSELRTASQRENTQNRENGQANTDHRKHNSPYTHLYKNQSVFTYLKWKPKRICCNATERGGESICARSRREEIKNDN